MTVDEQHVPGVQELVSTLIDAGLLLDKVRPLRPPIDAPMWPVKRCLFPTSPCVDPVLAGVTACVDKVLDARQPLNPLLRSRQYACC